MYPDGSLLIVAASNAQPSENASVAPISDVGFLFVGRQGVINPDPHGHAYAYTYADAHFYAHANLLGTYGPGTSTLATGMYTKVTIIANAGAGGGGGGGGGGGSYDTYTNAQHCCASAGGGGSEGGEDGNTANSSGGGGGGGGGGKGGDTTISGAGTTITRSGGNGGEGGEGGKAGGGNNNRAGGGNGGEGGNDTGTGGAGGSRGTGRAGRPDTDQNEGGRGGLGEAGYAGESGTYDRQVSSGGTLTIVVGAGGGRGGGGSGGDGYRDGRDGGNGSSGSNGSVEVYGWHPATPATPTPTPTLTPTPVPTPTATPTGGVLFDVQGKALPTYQNNNGWGHGVVMVYEADAYPDVNGATQLDSLGRAVREWYLQLLVSPRYAGSSSVGVSTRVDARFVNFAIPAQDPGRDLAYMLEGLTRYPEWAGVSLIDTNKQLTAAGQRYMEAVMPNLHYLMPNLYPGDTMEQAPGAATGGVTGRLQEPPDDPITTALRGLGAIFGWNDPDDRRMLDLASVVLILAFAGVAVKATGQTAVALIAAFVGMLLCAFLLGFSVHALALVVVLAALFTGWRLWGERTS